MIDLNKGKIIIFTKLNMKHYYLMLFVLCSLLRRLIPFIIEIGYGKLEIENFNKSCVFDMISNFTADFSVGIYKLILFLIKDKKKENEGEKLIEEEKEETSEDENDSFVKQKRHEKAKSKNKKRIRKKFFIFMLIISIVDILAQLCLLFSYFDKQGCSLNFSSECGNEPKINEDDLIFTVAINIIFRYIFSRLLLTVYIYPHHLISMIVTIISFIPLIIFNIITIYRG